MGGNKVKKLSDGGDYMLSVPASVTTTSTKSFAKGNSAIVSISSDSFRKDGRTISVGDCALFKPPHFSPPYIGIIRCLSYSKEDNLLVLVNWLYRPAELKLGEGILLEAAPNEIFYSFHKDEIPAASLLHLCRVAFLPKGVELPSGISSFVSRRVYDIVNKCLWWLTDQDFIKERQEEVDQLLYKTRIKMHETVQPGGHSPKSINGPTSTSQLRPGSDSVQNITSFPSQGKGKKRERGDQGSDPVKRERYMKTDNWDSGHSRTEKSLKSEIAKITEKGGLVDFEGVEKLVHIMQPVKAEKKMDLTCRTMLARVLAATDKFDCLNKFVQLRGLPVLDEWLQDIHKGKIGDGSSSKDGDKSVEEFLLVLLRALVKLPVGLHALQMCNIGRSVNHLSKHKSSEIQKKARSLVDTWKKRVDAEMNVLDSKSGSKQTVSWPSKSRLPENPHGGKRNYVGSGDVAARSSVTQLCASKASSNKASPGETAKSASLSPGPVKSTSSLASVRDSQPKVTVGGASDVPLTTREDKSSISSQSHNYSQSFSGKEDAKSSTAGSLSVSKVSSSRSRHQKSMNKLPGASVSGGPKETSSSRSSSLQRSSASERHSHYGLTGEKALDVPVIEKSSHRLIVKIPNRGRSPAQSTSGGSFEDPSIMSSRASSPVLSDKHDQFDRDLKDRSDAYRANVTSDVNAESWQSNDVKDVVTGSNDGDGSPAGLTDEERVRIDDDVRKVAEDSKAASSSSEANTSISTVDDMRMNLLASAAAGDMSKSDLVSPIDSPLRSSPAVEEACIGDDARSKESSADNLVQDGSQPNEKTDGDDKVHAISPTSWPKDESRQTLQAPPAGDRKATSSSSEEKPGDQCMESDTILDEMKGASCLSTASITETSKNCRPLQEEKIISSNEENNLVSHAELQRDDSLVNELDGKDVKLKTEVMLVNHLSEDECGNDVNKSLKSVTHMTCMTQKSPSVKVDGEVLPSTVAGKELAPNNVDELKVGGADTKGSRVLADEFGMQSHVQDTGDENSSAPDLEVTYQKSVCLESRSEKKVVLEDQPCISPQNDIPTHIVQDVREYVGAEESKPVVLPEWEQCISTPQEASSSYVLQARDTDSKMKFDLNEGFLADDGNCEEPVNVFAPAYASNIQAVYSFPFAAASVSIGLPAPVTIAAAAKGPFVPPEDLLRSKGELGWKGSAATSAFRPAEPRKVSPVPLVTTSLPPLNVPTSKHTRAPLDFDLNVADESISENLASQDSVNESSSLSDFRGSLDISHNELKGLAHGHSSGGLDLDLNRTDELLDMGQYPASSSCRPELPVMPVKSTPRGFITSGVRRDFDLNDGPSVDDANTEQPLFLQHARGSVLTQPPVAGLRISNAEIGNFPSWFPPGNSYSTVTIPSIIPDRVQQQFPITPSGAPQRILGPAGSAAFTSDLYRGTVLSSSPAVPFPSSPFPCPVYQFGSTYPLPSANFSVGSSTYIDTSCGGRFFTPPVNSQLLGHVDAVSSHYPRPYLVSLPEGISASSAENSRKWRRQGFDLNAGPGAVEVEGRGDILLMVSNQPSGARSQSLAEGQGRLYPAAGGSLKRAELDGGRDNDNFRHKQPSWR